MMGVWGGFSPWRERLATQQLKANDEKLNC
jgi:hypothetical protein